MLGRTNAVSGGKIKIPSVSNLNVDQWGVLTFNEPDYSKLAKYDPTISYIVDVNGTSFETTYNDVNVLRLLVEGENTVGVIVKAVLKDFSSDTSEVIMFSIPQYTNPTFFTLEATTVDNVNGYKITAYNGTGNEINIPQYNTDGLPILELNRLDIPKINGDYIKKINTFKTNTKIEEINLPETTNTSFKEIFGMCEKLSKVNINTSNATNLSNMFSGCSSLITAPWLDTSKATNMSYMFASCDKLKNIPLYDISSATNTSYMFQACSALETIPQFNTSKSTDMTSMFYRCSKLTTIPQLDTGKVYQMSYIFQDCSSLTTIPLLNTVNVYNMSGMFYGCKALTKVPLLDTSKVGNMQNIFSGCSKLTTIPQLDTTNATNMGGMFNGCQALMIVPLLNTSKATNMNYTFQNCGKLTEIPAFDVSNVNSFASTFHNCISLRSIHMTGMKASFDISESTQFTDNDLHEIIDNLATVSSTQTLTMGATNLAKVKDTYVEKAANKGWTLA